MKKIILAAFAALCSLQAFAADEPTLRVGIEGAYPPFSEVDASGNLKGFDVDFSYALCKEVKMKCKLVQNNWDGMIPALKAHRFDVIISSMSATPERMKSVDFTDKYYATDGRLAAKADLAKTITTANLDEALKGKILGVQRGTIHDNYATAKLANVVKEIRRYNTQDEANLDLKSGRIDATLADQIQLATGFLGTKDGEGFALAEPKFNDPAFYGKGVAIALRKGDDALKAKLNAGIKAMREDGTYQKIDKKYFNFDIY